MPDIDTVLFDLYDTLVWCDWSGQAELLANRLGVDESTVLAAYDDLRLLRDGGTFPDAPAVLAAVVETCGVEPEPGLIAELAAAEAEFLAEHVRWYEDSLPVLRRLMTAGYKTGVVSNCSPSSRPVVDRLGVENETGSVTLSCEVGEAKPSPGIFRTALRALGSSPETAVFIDDRGDYLDGAADLGMGTFRIARSHAFGEDAPDGDYPVITDLTDLERQL